MKWNCLLIYRTCLAIFLVLFGCANPSQTSPKNAAILVSIPPYQYFVDRISGGELQAQTIVPPGTNPHLFEPSPQQIENLRNAALWFSIGESFEIKIAKVLKEQCPNLAIVDMKKHLHLIHEEHQHCSHGKCGHSHHEDAADLHVWLSPKMAKEQATTICRALVTIYPDKKERFENNTKIFIEELEQLDKDITLQLEPLKDGAVLVSHPAFGYFCRDYRLKQLSIECEGKDPLPQTIAHTLHLAKEYKVQNVLLQPQYNNKGAEMIAEELSLSTYLLDPYSKNYMENLRSLAAAIAPKKPAHE